MEERIRNLERAYRILEEHREREKHREVWLALCAGSIRRRLVLAARLMCGRPFGVWRMGRKSPTG